MAWQKDEINELTSNIIGAAINIHRELGPGLLESVYEECLAYELTACGIGFERQKPIPVIYKSVQMDCGFRLDLMVCNLVVVEVKAVDRLLPIHEAQLLTYLKLTQCEYGLLMNFNVIRLKDGIKRMVLSPQNSL